MTVIGSAGTLTPLECPQHIVAEFEKLVETVPAQ